MPTLKEVVTEHLESHGKSIRTLAREAGITYPTLLGVLNRGTVPRKKEHREALRRALGYNEDDWNEILVASTSSFTKETSDDFMTLQQLISREMYAKGFTEQGLAESAGVAYSTVMGITRKGSIPRKNSLKQITGCLEIDDETVKEAVQNSRSIRQTGVNPVTLAEEPAEVDHLSALVVKHIMARTQTVGAFAQDLRVGYLVLSKFLNTGVPPDDENVLIPLQKMLGIDDLTFEAALDRSRRDPTPAELPARDDLLAHDANPLQHAMVNYMRDQGLTLKTLAKRAGLSQVTVSRLVKQGQAPTRATTHIKLQELLGLTPSDYEDMTSEQQQAKMEERKERTGRKKKRDTTALTSKEDDLDEDVLDSEDNYLPHEVEELPFDLENPPSRDELVALVRQLGPKQREALRSFLKSMV